MSSDDEIEGWEFRARLIACSVQCWYLIGGIIKTSGSEQIRRNPNTLTAKQIPSCADNVKIVTQLFHLYSWVI